MDGRQRKRRKDSWSDTGLKAYSFKLMTMMKSRIWDKSDAWGEWKRLFKAFVKTQIKQATWEDNIKMHPRSMRCGLDSTSWGLCSVVIFVCVKTEKKSLNILNSWVTIRFLRVYAWSSSFFSPKFHLNPLYDKHLNWISFNVKERSKFPPYQFVYTQFCPDAAFWLNCNLQGPQHKVTALFVGHILEGHGRIV
jgi:hypothetical protein